MKVKTISPRKILNSADKWTIETTIELDDGSKGEASIPGGISKGKNEVAALPADEAVKKVEKISTKIIEKGFSSQEEFDNFLIDSDSTDDKSILGGNSILSLSVAFCKATAQSKGQETFQYIADLVGNDSKPQLPQMMMLMLEGGEHGSGGATIQEFMAIVGSLERGSEIYAEIKEEIERLGETTNVGAEGAFSPEGYDNDQILSLLSGFLHGEEIALDVAASSSAFDNAELPNYEDLMKSYPIGSIEDPFSEDDWTNWELFAQKNKDKVTIVADDLTTTNPKILKEAIDREVANAIIIKPNQIGSVTETLEVVKMAHANGWQTVVSHRGTDTNDDFVADLAVGVGSEYVKFGAPARGERVVKYNRLIEIV